jgi:hypothetical protein
MILKASVPNLLMKSLKLIIKYHPILMMHSFLLIILPHILLDLFLILSLTILKKGPITPHSSDFDYDAFCYVWKRGRYA